jgi:NAD(P)-dependent dehydrogenase (short-subunit alcohol dehydrogenase family)
VTDEAAIACVSGRPLLSGSVVILTGAAGGIGHAIGRMLVAAGARVALTDLAEEPVGELASELGAFGQACDAASSEEFGAFHARVEDELGPVDGIVSCAGRWSPAAFDGLDERAFGEMLDANLKTAFVACRVVVPGMVERGRGSVVTFASTAGEVGSFRPGAHYAAAKGGVIALTKSLAREVSPAGVRVNAISPGPVDTPALLAATAEQRAIAGGRTLLGRLGRPHEIAGACVFLLSPLSSFVTATVLQVSGGAPV